MKNQEKKLDLLPTSKLVNLFLNEEQKMLTELKKQKTKISKAINVIVSQIKKQGRVIYIGAGTSGRIGVLDAVECKPTFNTKSFQAIIAGGNSAFLKAKEGAEDNKKQAIKDLKQINLNKNDVLIGVSASGETPYTISAVKFGKKKKVYTIGITANPYSTLTKIAKLCISTNTQEELISGSSRLKSGTAQKIILNTLSTASMIKLGKVFNNLMIDVEPTNKKLVKRAIGIISIICKVPFNKAKVLFKKAKRNTKAAIVMHYKNCNLSEALKQLQKVSFNLRKIIS